MKKQCGGSQAVSFLFCLLLSPLRFSREETATPREHTEGTHPHCFQLSGALTVLISLPPSFSPSSSSMVSSYLSCGCKPYRRTLAMPAWSSLLQLCPTSLPRRRPWASLLTLLLPPSPLSVSVNATVPTPQPPLAHLIVPRLLSHPADPPPPSASPAGVGKNPCCTHSCTLHTYMHTYIHTYSTYIHTIYIYANTYNLCSAAGYEITILLL